MTTASYRLAPREPLGDGLRRVASEEIDAAIAETTNPSLAHSTAIHQARKRCKRIRALLSLYRGTLVGRAGQSAAFRELAHTIAPLRDADSLLEAFASLAASVGEGVGEGVDAAVGDAARARLAPVGEALALRRDRIAATGANPVSLRETVAMEMRRARPRVASWSLRTEGWTAIEEGFGREVRRARAALDHFGADASGEQVHDLRKATKGHWYHTRLLRDAWPERLDARRASLKTLADLLGEDHDLGILLALAPGLAAPAPGLVDARIDDALIDDLGSAIAARRGVLRGLARPMAEGLYEQDAESFISEVARHWRTRAARATGPRA